MNEVRDAGWFDGVYRRHYHDVLRYGFRRLLDLGRAEELAQDTFAVCWRRRAGVPPAALPWLYGVARNLLANELRARGRRPALVGIEQAGEVADPAAGDVSGVLDVERALKSLPERDRELLMLIAWEGLSVTEAARVLECSPLTTSVRLLRARRRLAEKLTGKPASTGTRANTESRSEWIAPGR